MPNHEVSFEAGGRTHTLRFTNAVLCRLEKDHGLRLTEIDSYISTAAGVRALVWAGLEGHRQKAKHRERPYTLEEAGDLIDEMTQAEAADLAVKALLAALAKPKGTPEDPKAPTGEGA